MKTEIIVVTYKQPEYEARCLKSVIECTKDFQLTLWDNRVDNIPLSKLWNKLTEESNKEYICLLNSDTVVTPNWLEKLESTLDNSPECGAVMPCSNVVGVTEARIEIPYNRYTKDTQEVYDFKFNPLGEITAGCLSGFCLLYRKKVWEEVGKFDEDFIFYGEDSEFTRRIAKSNWHLRINKNVFVHHYGGVSAEAANDDCHDKFNRQEMVKFSRELYKKKIL